MPLYRYTGSGPCRYGTKDVNAGDVVDASAQPGKNFALVEEQEVETKVEPTQLRRRAVAADVTTTTTTE